MALNLALLSDQDTAVEGHAVESRLLELLPVRRQTVCYLPSAPDPNRSWFEPRAQYYARHGLNLSYFGVETEFEAARVGELRSCDAIHLSGGNTFRFMHWLRERGLDEVLKDYAIAGGVLIGVSAGAIIMTPDLGTAALCGDAPYPDSKSDAGLGLVDFAVLPHSGPVVKAAGGELEPG